MNISLSIRLSGFALNNDEVAVDSRGNRQMLA